MALPLALPTFSGLPDDAVKKIDVYSDLDSTVQTSAVSKVSAFDTSLSSIISKSLSTIKGIGDNLSSNGINLATAQERIRSALGGSRSAITDISSTLERSITSDLTGVQPGTGYVSRANSLYDSVSLVINGTQRNFLSSDYKTVTGVMGFIQDLTNNQLINTFDLGAQAALVKGILTEVTKWGIPEVVDEAFGAKWNASSKSYDYQYDDTFRFSVTKSASDSISGSTSLAVIQQLIIHGGDKALIAANPSFPTQLLAGYVIPDGCAQGGPYPVDATLPYGTQTKDNYAYQGHLLIEILNTLLSNWFYDTRTVATGDASAPYRTDTVWNLSNLAVASEDAQSVLKTNSDLATGILAAPFYKTESGIAMLKSMYEYFVE